MSDWMNDDPYRRLKANPSLLYIIANAGLAHAGNKERALALLRAAKWAGADAVSFKSPTADLIRHLGKEAKRVQIDITADAIEDAIIELFDAAGASAFKLAADQIVNRRLVQRVAEKGKPVLFSTGAVSIGNIVKATEWMQAKSNGRAVLVHEEPAHLKSVQYIREDFGVLAGFADYGANPLTSIVAASLGAQVIEIGFVMETRGEGGYMDAKALKSHTENLRVAAVLACDRSSVVAQAEPVYAVRRHRGVQQNRHAVLQIR
jgi:pseudaminic acid synthase